LLFYFVVNIATAIVAATDHAVCDALSAVTNAASTAATFVTSPVPAADAFTAPANAAALAGGSAIVIDSSMPSPSKIGVVVVDCIVAPNERRSDATTNASCF
jgi:hypothetical protein